MGEIKMTREEIKPRFIDILKKYTPATIIWDSVTENDSIIGKLNVNSARFVDLIIDVEDAFEIDIDDERMNQIITIKNGIDMVESLTADR